MGNRIKRLFLNQFALRCPKCKRSDRIDVAAVVWVRLTRKGSDKGVGGVHAWRAHNDALCSCGFRGLVADFHTYQCKGCGKIHNHRELQVSEKHEGCFCECGAICRRLGDSEDVKNGK